MGIAESQNVIRPYIMAVDIQDTIKFQLEWIFNC